MTVAATGKTSELKLAGSIAGVAKESQTATQLSSPHAGILGMQRAVGNRVVNRFVQTKLKISTPGDRFEREADTVADQVMRMFHPGAIAISRVATSAGSPTQPLQRACSHCEDTMQRKAMCDDCEAKVQRSARSDAPAGGNHAFPAQVAASRGGGQPLSGSERAFFESRFNYDFGGVRIHTNNSAAQAADSVSARAFTVGGDIFFGARQYAPGSARGQRLLAHELTHVIQQQSAGPMIARAPGDNESATLGTELEASEVAAWKASLEKQGYEVYSRKDFEKVEWLKKAFPDKRARPDLVAINRSTKKILVGDITASSSSTAELKPGDQRKLPNEIGGDVEAKAHLEKTMDNAKQLSRNRPTEIGDYQVSARDRYWRQGGYSREVVVTPVAAKPAVAPVKPSVAGEGTPVEGAAAPPKPTVTPPEAVPPEGAPVKPGGGKGSGIGSGLLGFALPIIAGWIHSRAVEKRIEERAKKEGYVPFGSLSGLGLLYDLGAWLIDPANDADKAVGIDKRFNFAAWRQHIRTGANAMRPGETLTMTWDIGKCKFDFLGRQEVEKRQIKYRKEPNGSWVVQSGNASGTPSLNDIVSPDYPDDKLKAIIMDDPCSA